MENTLDLRKNGFDKTNALVGVFVFILSFIVYRLTVAPTLSYWDCGEFIACAYILGIPHPPGSPLFVVLGRIFSTIPFAADICFRVNMISVISSAVTVLFGYLSVVRMIKFWYQDKDFSGWKRTITYIGGFTGSMFMAFSATYWGNAIEAEVYGLSMMFMTIILWLMLIYYENQGTPLAKRIVVLVCYLAMLGVAIHLTTFLIMPVAAIFFILKKGAPVKAWVAICLFFVAELLTMILVADGRGGFPAFILATLIFLLIVAYMVYKYINWPVLIGIVAFSLIMVGFYQFIYALFAGAIVMLILAGARKTDWKMGLTILLVAITGFSFHLFIPIRSKHDPRIDENNPSRNFSIMPWAFFDGQNETFINYLDRKQYGNELMVERAFARRGTWAHQFGRHAHMGFWSYFEEQYGLTKIFGALFLVGLFGIYMTTKRKTQIGLPFLILLLLATAGLVLYMNFADGIKYNPRTGDAYLEVRNRDYFFTPGFAYFGLALGLGLAALMELVREKTSTAKWSSFKTPAMAAMCLLIFLPTAALTDNYFENDRSRNYYPRVYSEDILETCDKDAILFTSGDNDTFPLWCVQEVYDFRKDVRVVNLSLFNTDWYIAQMKNQYGVPISLDDDQIIWNAYDYQGREVRRPEKPFYDRPRKRRTYLIPAPFEGRTVKLQDMMVDEVVLDNKWKYPIYFSSEPYQESPLKLRDYTHAVGILYKIDTVNWPRKIDAEEGYHLFKDVYKYTGLNDPNIYRDENATGVMLAIGFNAVRLANEFQTTGQMDKAFDILNFIIEKYPEFYQAYSMLADMDRQQGDSSEADSVLHSAEDELTMLNHKNPDNQFYLSDLGLVKFNLGKTEEALPILWEAFDIDPNSGYAYRKLMQVLYDTRNSADLYRATKMHGDYKANRNDPLVQQILGGGQSSGPYDEDY